MRLLKQFKKTIITTAFILFLSFYNIENLKPDKFELFENADKLIHLIMYFGLTVVLLFEYRLAQAEKWSKQYIISLYPVILGALIEILQHYLTEGRSGEWLDLVANVTGILIALLVFRFLKNNRFLIRIIKFPAK